MIFFINYLFLTVKLISRHNYSYNFFFVWYKWTETQLELKVIETVV